MEYKIIGENDVNGHLSEEWELHGPPFPFEGAIIQAMTRKNNQTGTFQVVTGIEGEWNAQTEICEKYGYSPIGEPQSTGKTIEVAGDKYPEVAVIFMKKDS